MRQVTQLLPAFNNVAIGGMATTKLPRNRRYHGLLLQYKTNAAQATIEADLTEIRLKVNGKVVRQFSSAQLNLINALNGVSFTAGMIPIWFSEPWRRTPEGEEFLGWLIYENLGVGDLEIEVDIAGGAVAPTLSGLMLFDYERPLDQVADVIDDPRVTDAMRASAPAKRTAMHWLKRVTPCAAAFTAAAPLSPSGFFPPVNGWLHRIHSFDAVVTQAILRDGETPFWNMTSVQLPALLLGYRLTKQASTFHVALDADQQYVDGLYIPRTSNLAIDFVASGAATGNQFTSVMEIRKPFDLS